MKTALVAGGSLGGLMAGGMLAREGWRVRIFERVAGGIEGRGTGIATHDLMFQAFQRAGAQVDDEIGIALKGRSAFDRAGVEICHYPYRQFLSSWSTLYKRLRAAVPVECYELGTEVVGIDSDADGVRFSFANSTTANGDVAIGADGIWSRVRSVLNPAAVPHYCGYVAWRGLVDEADLPAAFCERYAPLHSFFIDRDEQFILYAVGGADDSVMPGRRRFGYLWYRAVDEVAQLPALLTDTAGRRNGLWIAPNAIQPIHVAHLKATAADILPPDFADIVCRTAHPFIQPICDLVSDRLAFGRVALVGDAAFVARPHVGAGVLKAAGDAAMLADCLAATGDVEDALCQFERNRLPAGLAMVEKARYLGRYLEGSRHNPPPQVMPADEVIRESGRG